ncbi:MAG: class I SAM-dependent methyltransferase [Planctomycetes bacterium]|nr:class I SAM-dependent methyltransferase [Planctomycetota bacterium]
MRHFRLPRKLVDREAYILAACAGKRVLHLGCVGSVRTGDWHALVNSGRWLHQRIRSAASEAIGIDIERSAVNELRERMGMTDILWGDAQELAALDCGSFDLVVAGEIIEHLPNPGRMLESAHAVLREDGHVIVTAPNAFCARKALGVLLGLESVHEDHVAYYSHRALQRLAAMYGYRVVDQCSYRLRNRTPLLPYVIERIVGILSPNLCEGVICRMARACES